MNKRTLLNKDLSNFRQMQHSRSNAAIIIVLLFTVICFIIATPLSSGIPQINVGIYNFAPLSHTTSPSHGDGIFTGILKYAAVKEGLKINYFPGTLTECMSKLDSGEIDIAAIAYSREKERRFDFSNETVLSTWAQVYVEEGDTTINSLIGLKGRTVGVVKEEVYNRNFRQIAGSFSLQCTVVEFIQAEDMFQALQKGWIDCAVTDRLYGVLNEERFEVKRTPIVFSPVEIRFATAAGQNRAVLDVLDYHLALLKNNPDSIYYQLVDQTLGDKKKGNISKLLLWSLGSAVGLLVLFVSLNLVLKRQVAAKTLELAGKKQELEAEVSERQAAEIALKESEEKFRVISEKALTPIAIIQDNLVVYANQAFARLTGYSWDEVCNWREKEYEKIIYTGDRAFVMNQNLKKQQGDHDVENHYSYRLITRSGSTKWVEHYSRTIQYRGRNAILMTVADITDMKTAELRLANEKERLSVTLRSIGDGVITTNMRNEVTMINHAAEQICGWSQDDAVGQNVGGVFRILRKKTGMWIGNPIQKIMLSDSLLESAEEMILEARDGTRRMIHCSCAPITDDNHEITGNVLVFHDTTEKIPVIRNKTH